MRFRIIHFQEVFNLKTLANNYKRREWIDSIEDLYRIKECIEGYQSVLFICYNKFDIPKVADGINDIGKKTDMRRHK
ncbi:hypothetical protein [Brevibacillus laterosporus]|uniref:hypothetical protein n=1 Tax=Brevibacillus laterosporus TaxID=1465 RepID=UPI0018F8AA85|nr:hypothetical protein [Brevibacillus laterosporus]MBG9773089.1 hypothetical protein [Brevibacillus laterosporus]